MTSHNNKQINKLILFVTENCNLDCRYCYVTLPQPHDQKRIMSEENARDIARQLCSRFDGCGFVQFFGGEPTLNMPAIWAFVDELEKMRDKGDIGSLPKFGIVTNGASNHAGELVDFCSRYDVSPTVSLDGEQPIHDALRPDRRQKGSYERVRRTIDALLEKQLKVVVESVYTAKHIDQGCSIIDLFAFIETLGVSKHVFHTAYPPTPKELCPFGDRHFPRLRDDHVAAVEWWFEALVEERSSLVDVYFKDLLVPLLQGGGSGVPGGGCPAGVHDLTVGPGGDAYSCHLLYGIPQHYLGNILANVPLGSEEGLPRCSSDLPECVGCFARHWCQPCGALNRSWFHAWVPPQRECELRRAVLHKIGELGFANLSIPQNAVTDVLRRAVAGGG